MSDKMWPEAKAGIAAAKRLVAARKKIDIDNVKKAAVRQNLVFTKEWRKFFVESDAENGSLLDKLLRESRHKALWEAREQIVLRHRKCHQSEINQELALLIGKLDEMLDAVLQPNMGA